MSDQNQPKPQEDPELLREVIGDTEPSHRLLDSRPRPATQTSNTQRPKDDSRKPLNG